jgi:hypothetical protein
MAASCTSLKEGIIRLWRNPLQYENYCVTVANKLPSFIFFDCVEDVDNTNLKSFLLLISMRFEITLERKQKKCK